MEVEVGGDSSGYPAFSEILFFLWAHQDEIWALAF